MITILLIPVWLKVIAIIFGILIFFALIGLFLLSVLVYLSGGFDERSSTDEYCEEDEEDDDKILWGEIKP